MRRTKVRSAIELAAFALGIIVNAFWLDGHFGDGDPLTQAALGSGAVSSRLEESLPQGWSGVDMVGKANFFIPPDVKQYPTDASTPYRAFYREGLEVSTAYTYAPYSAVCRRHADEKLDKPKVARVRVAGRDATILHVDKASFGHIGYGHYEPPRGLAVCVPDLGDGQREFTVVVGYTTEQDYQDALRIIDTVRFP